jgi:glutamine synthetase
VSWSGQNRSSLVRIPAAAGEYRRAELRSPDPGANPYLAFTLLIYAALDGMEKGLALPAPVDRNLYSAPPALLSGLEKLPGSLAEARAAAAESAFLRARLPAELTASFCGE